MVRIDGKEYVVKVEYRVFESDRVVELPIYAANPDAAIQLITGYDGELSGFYNIISVKEVK